MITLRILILTYKLQETVKQKFQEYLQQYDENIVEMLQHFTTRGGSSTIGDFYNLYIVEEISNLKLAEEYKKRLVQITQNAKLMEDLMYINYYSGNMELVEYKKMHIVDKSISLLEKLMCVKNDQ